MIYYVFLIDFSRKVFSDHSNHSTLYRKTDSQNSDDFISKKIVYMSESVSPTPGKP